MDDSCRLPLHGKLLSGALLHELALSALHTDTDTDTDTCTHAYTHTPARTRASPIQCAVVAWPML
jgi:hypothetical protein